jgi:hypothetical protein
MLSQGATYPLEPLSEAERLLDLEEAIEFGNHKSAQRDRTTILESIRKEIIKGWQIRIPIWSLRKLNRVAAALLGLTDQMKLSATGDCIPSKRVTHNMFQSFVPGKSVNKRLKTEELTRLVYGFSHQIVTTR